MASSSVLDDICSDDPQRVAAALREAGPQQALLADDLIARLADAAAQPLAWSGKGKPNPGFLLYLAAAWRDPRAFPYLVALLRLPEHLAESILGDIITEGAATILADTYSSDPEPLHALIQDRTAYGFARGAGLDALAKLVVRGRYPREAFLGDLNRLADHLDAESDSDTIVGGSIVSSLLDLRAWERRGLALRLYERGLVDHTLIRPEEVEDELVPEKSELPYSERLNDTITDAWQALSSWSFFTAPRPKSTPQWRLRTPELPEVAPERNGEDPIDALPRPYIAPPKVGRNEPCPCGSGKKFKKCCGA